MEWATPLIRNKTFLFVFKGLTPFRNNHLLSLRIALRFWQFSLLP
jgi:hypothetical protein